MKLSLPNTVPAPNTNNLVSEYQAYINLYNNLNRTGKGSQYSIGPLASSGKFYSTADYPDDVDVYNNGQEGMMNLLYKYVLKPYLVDVDLINEIQAKLASIDIVYDVTVQSIDGVLTVVAGLPETLPSGIYDIRFFAPADAKEGEKLSIGGGNTPFGIYTLNGMGVSEGLWAQNSIVRLTITGPNSKATLSGGGSGCGGFQLKSGNPSTTTFTESDKQKLWIDQNTGVAYYWNEAARTWKPIAGTFS